MYKSLYNIILFIIILYLQNIYTQNTKSIDVNRLAIVSVLDFDNEEIVRDTITLIKSYRAYGGSLNNATYFIFIISDNKIINNTLIIQNLLLNYNISINILNNNYMFGSQNNEIKPQKTLNKYYALNQIDLLIYDYILWLDSDMLILHDFAHQLLSHSFPDGSIDCIPELYSYMRRYPTITHEKLLQSQNIHENENHETFDRNHKNMKNIENIENYETNNQNFNENNIKYIENNIINNKINNNFNNKINNNNFNNNNNKINEKELYLSENLNKLILYNENEITFEGTCNTGFLFFDRISLKFFLNEFFELSNNKIIDFYKKDRFIDSLLFVLIININKNKLIVNYYNYSLNFMAFFEFELINDLNINSFYLIHFLAETSFSCMKSIETNNNSNNNICKCNYYNPNVLDYSLIQLKLNYFQKNYNLCENISQNLTEIKLLNESIESIEVSNESKEMSIKSIKIENQLQNSEIEILNESIKVSNNSMNIENFIHQSINSNIIEKCTIIRPFNEEIIRRFSNNDYYYIIIHYSCININNNNENNIENNEINIQLLLNNIIIYKLKQINNNFIEIYFNFTNNYLINNNLNLNLNLNNNGIININLYLQINNNINNTFNLQLILIDESIMNANAFIKYTSFHFYSKNSLLLLNNINKITDLLHSRNFINTGLITCCNNNYSLQLLLTIINNWNGKYLILLLNNNYYNNLLIINTINNNNNTNNNKLNKVLLLKYENILHFQILKLPKVDFIFIDIIDNIYQLRNELSYYYEILNNNHGIMFGLNYTNNNIILLQAIEWLQYHYNTSVVFKAYSEEYPYPTPSWYLFK